MKKYKKYIPLLILLIIIILYLLVPVFIYPDSVSYYNTSKILLGLEKLSSWDTLRGPTMALVLSPFLKILGNNEFSIRICTCVFYIILIITSYTFINKEIKTKIDANKQNLYKKITYCIILIFIVLNPILYGYYHSLLTEFVATTISIINILLVIKLNSLEQISKKDFIISIIYGCIIFPFSWFLKQPYFSISFFPLLILLLLKFINKNNRIKIIVILITSIVSLILSINIWNKILINNNANIENNETNSYFLNKAIIDSNSNYEKVLDPNIYTLKGITDNVYLSGNEKKNLIKLIENNNKNYIVYYIHNLNGDIIDAEVFYYKNEAFTFSESIKFTLNAFKNHPVIVIDSYISNYLSSINIYPHVVVDNYYRPYKKTTNFHGENGRIGLAYVNKTSNNIKWIENTKEISNLEVKYQKESIILEICGFFYLLLYKFLYLLLPIFWIYIFIKILKRKKQYETPFIFITFVLMHTIFHVLMGAIIDRYIYITHPAYILGIISFILATINSKNLKIRKEK